MATYKVLATFKDKNDQKVYQVGDTYQTEDQARLDELAAQNFIQKQAEEADVQARTRETQEAKNQEVQDLNNAKSRNEKQKAQADKQQQQQTAENAQSQAQHNQAAQQQETHAKNNAKGKSAKESGE